MAQNMTYKIHVLLVDHDTTHHMPTIEMLEHFSYKVTTVSLASTALSILSKEKHTFDLVMININSPDSCGFGLLQRAAEMELPAMLLLDEDDVMLTRKAIEDGALLCIKMPLPKEIAEYLWQHVKREKLCTIRENGQHSGLEEDLMTGNMSDNTNLGKNYKSKKVGHPKFANPDEESNLQDHDVFKFRRKISTKRTQDLHEKSTNAVKKLGEGRCYPKEIHELMNVPGFTRRQVASHLQILNKPETVTTKWNKASKSSKDRETQG